MYRFASRTVVLAAIAACALGAVAISPALAATTPPMPMPMDHNVMFMTMGEHMGSVSVQGEGEVQYAPDIAHVTVGVNGEAASAAAATSDVANRANAVIAALKALGIPASDIKTSGFNLYYRQASEGPAGSVVKGAFVASESISVKTPVDKAGPAIDAAIRAGANQTYGLEYETSQRDSLYRQAVQRAIAQARELAAAAASAAGVKLGAVTSIVVGGAATPFPIPMMRAAMPLAQAAPAPPPISPGTGTISASVSMTYAIAR
jgi:uncharacterized protein